MAKVSKAIEKVSSTKPFAISAPIGEGIEPLLDAIITPLGDAREVEREDAEAERPWSPL